MDDTLFPVEDIDRKRFVEPFTTPQERARRLARMSDPQTSWDAIPSKPALTKTKQRILDLLVHHPEGLTSSEVAHLLDMDKGSSSKRLGDLEHDKWVEACGTRPSDRKRQSTIYKLKDQNGY